MLSFSNLLGSSVMLDIFDLGLMTFSQAILTLLLAAWAIRVLGALRHPSFELEESAPQHDRHLRN